MERVYALLADAIVLLHLGYVLFTVGGEAAVVLGGLLRWRWVRNLWFRIAHLLSVVLVAIEALTGVLCPLTQWEYTLRRLAGQIVEEQIPFMARLVRRLIFYDFPEWVFVTAYILFAAVVAASLLLVPPRRPSRN
jgi:hypothetical protein